MKYVTLFSLLNLFHWMLSRLNGRKQDIFIINSPWWPNLFNLHVMILLWILLQYRLIDTFFVKIFEINQYNSIIPKNYYVNLKYKYEFFYCLPLQDHHLNMAHRSRWISFQPSDWALPKYKFRKQFRQPHWPYGSIHPPRKSWKYILKKHIHADKINQFRKFIEKAYRPGTLIFQFLS